MKPTATSIPTATGRSASSDAAIQSESHYFDTLVVDKGDFNPFAERGWRTLSRQFETMIPLAGPLRLLDIGCGTGQSRQLYADRAKLYCGIDLSQRALEIARSRFPDSCWERADACALPFADASWDVVAFSSVLHHIPHFGRALAEAYRVLKPGGYAFAFDPNLLHPAMALFRWPRSPLYLAQGVSPNERPLTPGELRGAFGASGFDKIRQHCQSDIPYRAVAPRLIHSCLWAYNAGDRLLQLSGLARWFGTFVVTAGCKPGSTGNARGI